MSDLVAVYCIEASQDAHKGCELPVQMPLYGLHPLMSILHGVQQALSSHTGARIAAMHGHWRCMSLRKILVLAIDCLTVVTDAEVHSPGHLQSQEKVAYQGAERDGCEDAFCHQAQEGYGHEGGVP